MEFGYITLGLGAGGDVAHYILLGLTPGTASPVTPTEILGFWSPSDPLTGWWFPSDPLTGFWSLE